MKANEVKFRHPVTLVGGGALTPCMIVEAMAIAPALVAADGAADRLSKLGYSPSAVVGDMDSIQDPDSWERGETAFIRIGEQETTDFEKCLYATSAPFYIATGFTGRRVDHTLAVFHAMLAHPESRVILLGELEVIALLPARQTLTLELAQDAIVSIFPLSPVKGLRSSGLLWPVEGLEMVPGKQIGTSNKATQPDVSVAVDNDGALVFLERRFLRPLIKGLGWNHIT